LGFKSIDGRRRESSDGLVNLEFIPLGESALTVQFGGDIDCAVSRLVGMLDKRLEERPFPGWVENVPAYTTLTVYYDPLEAALNAGFAGIGGVSETDDESDEGGSPYYAVCRYVQGLFDNLSEEEIPSPRQVEIPVCYGGEYGPDLTEVALRNGMSERDVIRFHTQHEYHVYMIGFAPGFPYLGGMPEAIAAPRRASPRLLIPAGSVGIGGKQTGVYPIASPGGWQLIGRTPVRLFRPEQHPPSLLQAGDTVIFREISRAEFAGWRETQEL
jgi:inhibitor of KinA